MTLLFVDLGVRLVVAIIISIGWQLIKFIYRIISNPSLFYKIITNKEYRKKWFEARAEAKAKAKAIEQVYKKINKTRKITEDDLVILTAMGPWKQENWLTTIRNVEDEDNAKSIAKNMVENMLYTSLQHESVESMREVFRIMVHYDDEYFIPKSVKEMVFEVWDNRENFAKMLKQGNK